METKEICQKLDQFLDEINVGGKHRVNLSLFSDAADRLEQQETEIVKLKQQLSQQQPEWISVEDRLPEPMESVLIYDHKNKRIAICRFGNCPTDAGSFCSHWMLLPEPPKPKEPTFKDKFLEAFPKAKIEEGLPKACVEDIFPWVKYPHCNGRNCDKCWNQPYFEPQEEGEQE